MVARILSPKRVRVVSGANTRFGAGGSRCPLDYYAVRDPSVVRVIPVDRPPLPNGFRHVKLSFKLDQTKVTEEAAIGLRGVTDPASQATSAFLMSIGLPLSREDGFYDRAIARHPDQDFTDLYARMRELGCDDHEPDQGR